WIDWARATFAEARPYPPIDQSVYKFDLLCDAYAERTDNEATREHLESCLARDPNDIATRFVILNYYYELAHFDSERKEGYVAHLREQFRRDLEFFVGLRPVEECTDADDISWEVVNACSVRCWSRADALYRQLRSTGEMPLGKFHA